MIYKYYSHVKFKTLCSQCFHSLDICLEYEGWLMTQVILIFRNKRKRSELMFYRYFAISLINTIIYSILPFDHLYLLQNGKIIMDIHWKNSVTKYTFLEWPTGIFSKGTISLHRKLTMTGQLKNKMFWSQVKENFFFCFFFVKWKKIDILRKLEVGTQMLHLAYFKKFGIQVKKTFFLFIDCFLMKKKTFSESEKWGLKCYI